MTVRFWSDSGLIGQPSGTLPYRPDINLTSIQVHRLLHDSQILVCTPSNSAADLVTSHLLTHIVDRNILRLNATTRPFESYDHKVGILYLCSWTFAGGKSCLISVFRKVPIVIPGKYRDGAFQLAVGVITLS